MLKYKIFITFNFVKNGLFVKAYSIFIIPIYVKFFNLFCGFFNIFLIFFGYFRELSNFFCLIEHFLCFLDKKRPTNFLQFVDHFYKNLFNSSLMIKCYSDCNCYACKRYNNYYNYCITCSLNYISYYSINSV